MPQLALVISSLRELRAQCETQLGAVTSAQRLVDGYRGRRFDQSALKGQLRSDLQAIKDAQAIIGAALDACGRAVEALPIAEASTR